MTTAIEKIGSLLNMAKIVSTFVIFFLSFLFCLSEIRAEEKNQFITIVNPVRIAYYTKDVSANIAAQYRIIEKHSLPATWLLTYDVLSNEKALSVLKKMDERQELGIFLEVSPGFANHSGVIYNEKGSWHFATNVFLSGYTQEERRKLIDAVFEKFKNEFGYYPKSVGSWWTDSFSLNYMKSKYNIVANLTCADQYLTDGYQIWGQYWSTPFYPSKSHAGIPAGDSENKIGVVTIQWAARDPYLGYQNSLYSTQDYFTKPQKNINYFKDLLNLYAGSVMQDFGQITVGLEGDLTPDAYNGIYKEQIETVFNSRYKVVTMKDFSGWYMEKFPDISPARKIERNGATWYQSPFYRVGIIDGKVIDLRRYADFPEPYNLTPNKQNILFINIPSSIDQMNNDQKIWDIGDAKLEFYPDYFEIHSKEIKRPKFLVNDPYFKVSKTNFGYRVKIKSANTNDLIFRNWSLEAKHAFKSARFWLGLLTGKNWGLFKMVNYWVSLEELTSLRYLATLPYGKVMVYDKECLQCEYSTQYKPAVFANLRGYVRQASRKPLVYNSTVFDSTDRETARNELGKAGVRYVYLVKYGSYTENLPFSPGDLGVKKIFENANSQVWQVDNKKY